MPVILATWETEIRRIAVQSTRAYLEKNQHKKKSDGVAQVVECLPSKHETLSSAPPKEKFFN
jgi:hypothetical protein